MKRYHKFRSVLMCLFLWLINGTICTGSIPDHDDKAESSSSKSSQNPCTLLIVEEGASCLGLYDSSKGQAIGRISLTYLPHEIAVSNDGRFAYVPNFGLRDYDMSIGNAGNCISVIDILKQCEIARLYTVVVSPDGKSTEKYWAPHGAKLDSKNEYLYVNVEAISGRIPDPTAVMGQQTKMLRFKIFHSWDSQYPAFGPPQRLPQTNTSFSEAFHAATKTFGSRVESAGKLENTYPVLPGTHNFVISPADGDLWYYAGLNGVARVDPVSGVLKESYLANRTDPNNTDRFNGAVRGLAFNNDGSLLLVSAYNEIGIINLNGPLPRTPHIIGKLGVTQVFYAQFTPDMKYVLAPAPFENQVMVIDIDKSKRFNTDAQRVFKRIITGLDPLQVLVHGDHAFITNADSPRVTEISLTDYTIVNNINTHQGGNAQGGPNGLSLSVLEPTIPAPTESIIVGACLPLTGQYAAEGRESRFGLQIWEQMINAAGGIVINNEKRRIEIVYEDTESRDDQTLQEVVQRLMKKPVIAVIGTYPPQANLPIAEALQGFSGTPFITFTGRDRALFDGHLSSVFSLQPQKEKSDLSGPINAICRYAFPKPRTAIILACNCADSLDEANALAQYAQENEIQLLDPTQKGKSTPGIIVFDHFSQDPKNSQDTHALDQLIYDLNQAALDNCKFNPDLLFVAGHRKESARIVRMCSNCQFTPTAIALTTDITSLNFMQQAGPVENLFSGVAWWESCCDFAQDRFVNSFDFQRNFRSVYGFNPSELVAGAAAAGIVVEEALHHFRDGEIKNLADSIGKLNFVSFFGPIAFSGTRTGFNISKHFTTIQLRQRDQSLNAIPVWPPLIAGKERPSLPSKL